VAISMNCTDRTVGATLVDSFSQSVSLMFGIYCRQP